MAQILIQYRRLYQTNTEWALLNAGLDIRSEMFESETFDYAEVTLTMTLQRHSAIYEATAVIPALGECVCSLRIPDNPGNVKFLFRNIAFRGKLF
jgi:hypothetical protein